MLKDPLRAQLLRKGSFAGLSAECCQTKSGKENDMRKVQIINDNWMFSRTCSSVPITFPTGDSFEKVCLPHTWNAVDGQTGNPFERGAYWYVVSAR